MYIRSGKVFYFITVVFFILALLYIYASLPEKVAYEVSDLDVPVKDIGLDAFFFISMGIFVALNLIIILPAKAVENQTWVKVRNLFQKGSSFREYMLAWAYSFAGIFNVNLLALVFYISGLNSFVKSESKSFDFMYYVAPLILMLWIIALFILLGKKIQQFQTDRLTGSNSNIN